MRAAWAAAALLAGATVLTLRPLPPDLRPPDGEVPAWSRPVLALEDWFDAHEGLGTPCRDREPIRRAIGGGLSLLAPRCFTLRRMPGGEARLADEGLAPMAAAVFVTVATGPRPAARSEQSTALGPRIRFWRQAGDRRVAFTVVIPASLTLSWKARHHLETLERIADSLAAEP